MEKHIVALIKLCEQMREKEEQINVLFAGEFNIGDKPYVEDIILDIMGFREEQTGDVKETEFYTRDYFWDILHGYKANENKYIVKHEMTATEKYKELKKELKKELNK